ncbi:DNA mismatch repair endonuclease MutL [Longirhabdus pacifica]|uniref:DNA mismatch repair endonuclease MutL n=1 Tax=Longirhabdus pacifica TaxID=2305227 RepID=UPI001008FBA6|nr:DNA mismatch repair endonuclease MutL [Longirhabdus pacifica]
MGRINILDDHIANQIAAGEVVERPSSVVKELVENAVDAGSSTIQIIIEDGGLNLIRVIDDGAGIEASDVEKAFCRHATSKIKSNRDLFQIQTLGFRGEALPSIAAVSKLECITSSSTSGLGSKMVIEGGKIVAHEETRASQGTDIKVSALFYNTPARLKYMKTIQTELSHVTDYVYRMALSHPHIAFILKHNGRLLLQTQGNGDMLQVIAAIYGRQTAKQMYSIEGEDLDYQLTGYASLPECTRANRNGITLMVNGRYIKHFTINKAILEAYHTLLPVHRFPIAVLHLKMDPTLLDVNVHPSKLEVRFSKETSLLKLVTHTLRTALREQVLIPEGHMMKKSRKESPAVIQEKLDLKTTSSISESIAPSLNATTHTDQRDTREQRAIKENDTSTNHTRNRKSDDIAPSIGSSKTPNLRQQHTTPVVKEAVRNFLTELQQNKTEQHATSMEQPSNVQYQDASLSSPSDVDNNTSSFPHLYPIGQMRGTYILAQNEDGLFLIDQHAAHERIHYEYYYQKFGEPEKASQELLVPITLEFTKVQMNVLEDRIPLFEQVGVYLEAFGGNTFRVHACPHWFPKGEEQRIIEEMAEWIIEEKKAIDVAKLREKASTLCSCKASIKANQSLSMKEMNALIERLAQCRVPYTCPHGRPIVVSFSNYELEKMFKRVM